MPLSHAHSGGIADLRSQHEASSREAIWSSSHVERLQPSTLRVYAKNARTHSKKQIKQIASSIERFGFNNPVLISDEDEIIAGHGRVEAAKLLGLPDIRSSGCRISALPSAGRTCLPTTSSLSMPAGMRTCWRMSSRACSM